MNTVIANITAIVNTANAILISDVTVGDNSVVAGQSVVTHDVPLRTFVGGNPARVIYIIEDRE